MKEGGKRGGFGYVGRIKNSGTPGPHPDHCVQEGHGEDGQRPPERQEVTEALATGRQRPIITHENAGKSQSVSPSRSDANQQSVCGGRGRAAQRVSSAASGGAGMRSL